MSADQIEYSKKTAYRPGSAKSSRIASSRPTTADYDPAFQEETMEEGGESHVPRASRTQLKLATAGGIVLFVVIFSAVLIVDSVHTIEEGNVGIYFVQGKKVERLFALLKLSYPITGALDQRYSHPGIHWAVPFVTVIEEITIRPQTETLEAISTVTRDGIQNTFHNIQVLSNVDVEHLIPLIKKFGMQFRRALVYDRVAEELRTFCANHTIDEVCFLTL